MSLTYRMSSPATLLAIASIALVPHLSHATSPPASWVNERTLECDQVIDGEVVNGEVIHTYLTPKGFGTPFNVVGSNDVIKPKYVEATFGGETFVTVNVPGFDPDGPKVVECTYVDPVGVSVYFLGLKTPAP